jgi:flagellar hook-basal body complex protein FliE
MSISAISPSLPGIQAPSALTGAAAPRSSAVQPPDFADLLGHMISNTSSALRGAEAASIAGMRGQLPVAQVVQGVMAAQETLQTAIAVRDKVVTAYQEISRMAI